MFLLGLGFVETSAQTDSGALCIATFADTNGNGMRDTDETPLPGVNVNLATNGMIIATHVTDEQNYCFENLQPGIYTLTFTDSPTYRTTTSNEGTFALAAGQRLTISEFGAVPVPLNKLRAEVAAQVAASQSDDEPLDSSLRLLISTVGSMMVMLFMIGVGAVILGTISGRRRKSVPPYNSGTRTK
jgi:hypothetical protein